jgi:Amt family ammonium transporter
LVLFMTLPGLALFYGGLVQSKNILSVLMHCMAIACLMSVLWLFGGYSLAFSEGNAWIGGLSKFMLMDVGRETVAEGTGIPETTFFMFQMTFAIITPALIIGDYVERIKFVAVLLFSTLWPDQPNACASSSQSGFPKERSVCLPNSPSCFQAIRP